MLGIQKIFRAFSRVRGVGEEGAQPAGLLGHWGSLAAVHKFSAPSQQETVSGGTDLEWRIRGRPSYIRFNRETTTATLLLCNITRGKQAKVQALDSGRTVELFKASNRAREMLDKTQKRVCTQFQGFFT